MELNKVYNEDCLIGMRGIATDSIDAIVTDPPYGISFMGKMWDYEVPGVEIWSECIRILKPGGHLISACGTRTQHRMAVNIEDAGFEIRDVITWHYGSGFPKSHDVSKGIDKRNGKTSEDVKKLKDELRRVFEISGLTLSQLNEKCGFEASGYLRQSSTWESVLPSPEKWFIIREAVGTDEDFSFEFKEAEREIIGKKSYTNSVNHFVPTEDHTQRVQLDITAPSTPEAKQWEGWGTALKPATEFWTLARKPLAESTVAENVLKYGTGGINIDGCRIGEFSSQGETNHTTGEKTVAGRFPANLIFDDFTAGLLDEQSGILKSGSLKPIDSVKKNNVFGKYKKGNINSFEANGAGASRFFYVAKPSKVERGEGNNHPTVKPIKLIEYLIKLIAPEDSIVLDPFMGSGTTAIACLNTNRNYVGFEKDEKYYNIIEERICKQILGDLY